MHRNSFRALALVSCLATAVSAQSREPLVWWTSQEAADLRAHIDSHPLGKAQLEKTLSQANAKRGGNPVLINLFRYRVLQDDAAGAKEKSELLKIIGRKPEPMTWDRDPKSFVWNEGMPSSGDSHMRDDQSMNVWRYEQLYDVLSPEERAGVEASFRHYIDFHLSGAYPRHPSFSYTRTGTLPNMHWPRPIGTHLMALALRDEGLIKAMFESEGGFKWFIGDYLADNFYMEEFNKYYSNITAMQLWCEGLERLGLGQYGYGYTGPSGNTMEGFLRMFHRLGYPRTDIPGGRDSYRRVTMGDAKGTSLGMPGLFEDTIVEGHLSNGQGGDLYWNAPRMNGNYPKGMTPIWFEMAARRFPDTGFEYFLHQMRAPGQDQYVPTLFTGLKPFDGTAAKAPPAPSYLSQARGFAFLRMEESPAYWFSPRPAVAQQFGMYYVHYTHDCFSLLGYHAFNRPIYVNAWGGNPGGYAGNHPWRDSTRGHAGVTVDNAKPKPIDRGDNGMESHRNIRFASHPEWKVSGALAENLWPGVRAERVLLLTDDYLVDVYRLESETERAYDWQVQGPGFLLADENPAWQPSADLDQGTLYRAPGAPAGEKPNTDNDLAGVLRLQAGGDSWIATFRQDRNPAISSANSVLGEAWYQRGIGVRVAMAGAPDTTVYVGAPPLRPDKDGVVPVVESGGYSLVVRRKAKQSTFASVHAPFEGGKAPDVSVGTLGDEGGVLTLQVTYQGRVDRVVLALGEAFAPAGGKAHLWEKGIKP